MIGSNGHGDVAGRQGGRQAEPGRLVAAALSRARGLARPGLLAGALAGALASGGAWAQAASAPDGGSAKVFRPPGCHGSQDAVVDRLAARIRRQKLYADWAKPGCLDYVVERCTAAVVEVSLHEKHDERCGGDPLTAPRVDSFRVHRVGERIDWYNVVDGAWRPFDCIHSEGHR